MVQRVLASDKSLAFLFLKNYGDINFYLFGVFFSAFNKSYSTCLSFFINAAEGE